MFRPNVVEEGTLDFLGLPFTPKSVQIFGWGHRKVPPKNIAPKNFLGEIGGGSKHVLGNFPYSEGVKCFRKKISPLHLGNFSKKKLHMGISTMAVKNIIFLKFVTEVKYPVIKVKGKRLHILVDCWVSRSATCVSSRRESNGGRWPERGLDSEHFSVEELR